MHIAFLDANTDRSAFAARHASEVDKFRALLAPVAPDWRYSDFKVTEGALPASLKGFDGVIVSGSPASVNDAEDWVPGLLATIRKAVDAGVPVFGACFGHQAVAKALGGVVAHNPDGWVLGRVETVIHTPAPWMRDAPATMALNAAHNEQVVTPPPGATVLGGTAQVPNAQLAMGNTVFTTQYHPEITRDFMADLITHLHGDVPAPVLASAQAALPLSLDDERMAHWIAAFFNGN
ncbi:type 1 glutamine amidotransferase [Pararhodobacter zhoushanensis]|uniref:Type 1 glutamine amidotransferase n=1 Tax=Pararhodobacter zhoushanensis TaxID=2479545 RepID=A0ABT3H1L2_9RHOB|nr:type 1 glutamine amidotransferase [Pararhodobacter zhoushanensis]MCW1933734.1 type 1 glutamine amidotransferase [Pararhodobacter zhoushanensis]